MKNFNDTTNLIDMDSISEVEQKKLDTLKNVVETESVGTKCDAKSNTKSDDEKDGRSRKSKMKRRPDQWNTAKEELAKELGLWDKVQREGWAGLTASESGKLGGKLSAKFPGKAPQKPKM